MYMGGYRGVPTIVLEVVASSDLWIWHAFFGVAGSNNDINVSDCSPVFDELLEGCATEVNYTMNGTNYTLGYLFNIWYISRISNIHQNNPSTKRRKMKVVCTISRRTTK